MIFNSLNKKKVNFKSHSHIKYSNIDSILTIEYFLLLVSIYFFRLEYKIQTIHCAIQGKITKVTTFKFLDSTDIIYKERYKKIERTEKG